MFSDISGDFLCYTLYTSFRALRSTLYTLTLRFISNSTIIKIPFLCTFPIFLWLNTNDEPKMKKCLGWHFECCARRVPTLRKSTAHRIKEGTPKLKKYLFVKIAVSFFFLIPCLIPPRDDRENSEGTPKELLHDFLLKSFA